VAANRDWYAGELVRVNSLNAAAGRQKTDALFGSLFAGWREPSLRRTTSSGEVVVEAGVPLRAMVAYLFGEVAKNFHLIHHPTEWIDCVTCSQLGDRCVDIDLERLPDRETMERELDWERGIAGPDRLNRWLEQIGATPCDYNRGLDDSALAEPEKVEFHRLSGGNFFRGLTLIDLAEAMLKKAFGAGAVAIRVNAAGQGDYFQVHIDSQKAEPDEVKHFLQSAFYRRFGISPDPEFVETQPGGPAVGVHLRSLKSLPQLIRLLTRADQYFKSM
jgi:hypothetical protein